MEPLEILLPVLMRLQARLDADLSLERVAAMAGLSPFHFHRLFKLGVGETLKAYTARVRLEQAAFRLVLHDETIVDIAIQCGFESHETFTRAFRRRFGMTPSAYRKQQSEWRERQASSGAIPGDSSFELSPPRVVEMRDTHLAFIRHVGPYEDVADTLWEPLEAFAKTARVAEPWIWFGIGHDAPGITAVSKLRFDAGLRVTGPFAPQGRVAHQLLPARTCALFTHVGNYSTLPAAYGLLFPQLFQLSGFRVIGLPAVEVYRTMRVDASNAFNQTDIYIPVERAGG